MCCCTLIFFFFKQKTAYEMRISDWSSDVCSSDLLCLMRLDDRAGFGVNLSRDMLFVKLLAKFDEAFLLDPLHDFRGAGHQPRKADGAEAVLREHVRGFGNLLDRHFAALEFLAPPRGRRIACDDRPVEIEQRGDMRSG